MTSPNTWMFIENRRMVTKTVAKNKKWSLMVKGQTHKVETVFIQMNKVFYAT